jgi:ribonuclease P protein component
MTHLVNVRLKNAAQFKLGMDQRVVAKSAHFALHAPTAERSPQDEMHQASASGMPGHMIGAVIPKRWAKRAVTRNAIRRQIYHAWSQWGPHLPEGVHVVRLKTGFDAQQFHSASSPAFKSAVRAELNQLFQLRAKPR